MFSALIRAPDAWIIGWANNFTISYSSTCDPVLWSTGTQSRHLYHFFSLFYHRLVILNWCANYYLDPCDDKWQRVCLIINWEGTQYTHKLYYSPVFCPFKNRSHFMTSTWLCEKKLITWLNLFELRGQDSDGALRDFTFSCELTLSHLVFVSHYSVFNHFSVRKKMTFFVAWNLW